MTLEEIKNTWKSNKEKLVHFSADRLLGLRLKPDTITFLTNVGLPEDAAPLLSFVNDSGDEFFAIKRLTEQYDLEPAEDFEKFIIIGSCHDGDVIAIDTSKNDEIVWLDHENYFSSLYFNSSLSAFMSCLIAYRNFVQTVQKDNGEDAFMESNFSDKHFETLKQQLTIADKRAISEEGFWNTELQMELALREDSRKNKG